MAVQSTSDAALTEVFEVDFDTSRTDLYDAVYNEDWERALSAVSSDAAEAKTWVVRRRAIKGEYGKKDSSGVGDVMWRFLPLHSACARQPRAEVISALLAAYPEGASLKDDEGM